MVVRGPPSRLTPVRSPDPDRPEIVCICGSTQFVEEMLAANRDLTFAACQVSTTTPRRD